MSQHQQAGQFLSRTAASAAVTSLGWRFVLGVALTTVRAGSLAEAARSAAEIAAQCGESASERLLIDVRDGYLILTVRNPDGSLAEPEVELVRQVSAIVPGLGLTMDARVPSAAGRSVQVLEIAIDALDIATVRPFWRAMLGYGDEPGQTGPLNAIVDPAGQGPGDLVPADDGATAAAQSDPPGHLRAA
jgi:4a-hydroxytetrahydrobiopterin dehydratase